MKKIFVFLFLIIFLFPALAEAESSVVLVLSGGGLRGIAHLGAVKVLRENGVKIAGIVGTSMGSLMGGLLAVGYSPDDVKDIVGKVDLSTSLAEHTGQLYVPTTQSDSGKDSVLFGLRMTQTGNQRGPLGFFSAAKLFDKFMELTSKLESEDFMRLPIPFAAVATDINTGEKVVLRRGNLASAMRASMAIPGVFEPWRVEGLLLVDGGLVSNLPVLTAKELFPGFPIIAVDVSDEPGQRREVQSIVDVLDRSLTILTHQNVAEERKFADLVIQPHVLEFGIFDQHESDNIFAAGVKAAHEKIGDILKLAEKSTAGKIAYLENPGKLVPKDFSPQPPDFEMGVSGYTTNISPNRWLHLWGVKRNVLTDKGDSLSGNVFIGENWGLNLAYRTAPQPSGDWEFRIAAEKWVLTPENAEDKNWTRYTGGVSRNFRTGKFEFGIGYAYEYANIADVGGSSSGPVLQVALNTLDIPSDPSSGSALNLAAWWADFDKLLFRFNFFKPFRINDAWKANFRLGFAEGNTKNEAHAVYLGAAEEMYSIAARPISGKRTAWANVAFRRIIGKSIFGTVSGEIFGGFGFVWNNNNELIKSPWEAGIALSVPNNLVDAKIALFYTHDKEVRFAFFLGNPVWGHYPLP